MVHLFVLYKIYYILIMKLIIFCKKILKIKNNFFYFFILILFLQVTCRENPKCRKMDLNSFLLAPVQRIMKYELWRCVKFFS